MHASVQALSQPRKDALDDAGVQAEPTIEHYEVLVRT